MAQDPNDIYHNGAYYNRNGGGGLANLVTDANSNPIGIVANNGVIPINTMVKSLKTIVIGNSIAQMSQHAATYWSVKSDIHSVDMIVKNLISWTRPTASTRMDGWGVYGYSGQTLPTILADLPAQVFTPLATAGIIPDLVMGHSLIENDIATGATIASMQASITQFIRDIKARYPSALIQLNTPRPSFSYNTPTLVANYQAMVTYILSLDNGYDIFVSNLSVNENPASPATPYGTSGSPVYTDATVHPNSRGALRNARVIANTMRRIAYVYRAYGYSISSNMAMSGTQAATGTGITGTSPTGVQTGSLTVSGSAVMLAEQSGFLQTITALNSGSAEPIDMSSTTIGWQAMTLSVNAQISPFVEVEIVSGASSIGQLNLRPQWAGTTGTDTVNQYVSRQTGEGFVDYVNGDNFMIKMPPMKVTDLSGLTGSITNCNPYLVIQPVSTGGTYTVRVKSWGVTILVP